MASTEDLERQKLALERSRYRMDVARWVVIAIGAVVSFAVIDYGKLRLERAQAAADSQRQLLEAYLKATESPEPEVWKRKLGVLLQFADDERLQAWARKERDYIDTFAAQDALYRETLKVASQLIEPARLGDPERAKARARFDQLYWADLPYVRESSEVSDAMVKFRKGLVAAEAAPADAEAWSQLAVLLIRLSTTLAREADSDPRRAVDGADASQ
jgi:hypothetical protein